MKALKTITKEPMTLGNGNVPAIPIHVIIEKILPTQEASDRSQSLRDSMCLLKSNEV